MSNQAGRELRLQQFLHRIETYTASLHETANMVDQTATVLVGPNPPAAVGAEVGARLSKDNGTMVMIDTALDRLQSALMRNNEVAQRLIGAL